MGLRPILRKYERERLKEGGPWHSLVIPEGVTGNMVFEIFD